MGQTKRSEGERIFFLGKWRLRISSTKGESLAKLNIRFLTSWFCIEVAPALSSSVAARALPRQAMEPTGAVSCSVIVHANEVVRFPQAESLVDQLRNQPLEDV